MPRKADLSWQMKCAIWEFAAGLGKGKHDAVIAFLWPESMATHTWTGGDQHGSRVDLAPDLVYQTADGYITAATISDAEWKGLIEAAERPEWAEDERFQTASGRIVHAAEPPLPAAERPPLPPPDLLHGGGHAPPGG